MILVLALYSSSIDSLGFLFCLSMILILTLNGDRIDYDICTNIL